MTNSKLPEVWQRGPVAGIPPLLQPVAHALLQAREEVQQLMIDFPDERLWIKPAGLANTAFHLQHLSGVLDRLFTYAREESLSQTQLEDLKKEGLEPETVESGSSYTQTLVNRFSNQVESSLAQLAATQQSTLTETRYIGRAKIPTTVSGLLFHAAEHTMRHLGQLLVTVKVVMHADHED